MREQLGLPRACAANWRMLKLALVGLPADAADKYPSQLSGGMRKRAGLARALALDPQIVFLDEPTSGLDPIGAEAFDQLILSLQQTLGLTVFMITHDLDSIFTACDRVAVLADHVIVREGAARRTGGRPGPSVGGRVFLRRARPRSSQPGKKRLMETRASHFLIGLFVLALLGLGFAFVYWVNNSAGGAGAQRYHVIFSGSVQGLGGAARCCSTASVWARSTISRSCWRTPARCAA